MNLSPVIDASPIIQIHMCAALVAMGLGPIALYRRRRDRNHKVIGYIWVLAMALTALSSFAIHSFALIGPFSPIHLLACLALWSLWVGVAQIRAGQVAAHQATMESLYWRGLCVAGLFNFLPGRVVNRTLFGESSDVGYGVILLGGAALVAHWYLSRKPMLRNAL